MAVSAKDIMMLRNKTSAGMALCKEALEMSDGNLEKAVEYINQKSDVVTRLYNLTGAKIGLCKIALNDAEGDFEKAVAIINERGWAGDPVDPDQSTAKEGVIGVYLHGTDRKTAAMVEVFCTTDFVARNENFIKFANELAIQAAAQKPLYVSRSDVPAEKVKEMEELFTREAKEEGKPEKMLEKIVEGKMSKFYSEKCLLEQEWFKDGSKKMQDLLNDAINQLGEPLEVKRVLVWQLGK